MGGSKMLILRENRAQHTIIGYFSASPCWVCQEYSTKRDYVFSLLFFHDPVPLIDQALVFMTFICLGIYQESVPNLRRSEYQTTTTTKPYWCWLRSATTDQGAPNLSQFSEFCGIPRWAQKRPVWASVFSIDYLLNDLCWGLLVQIFSMKLTGV